jgi:hypothetical protein
MGGFINKEKANRVKRIAGKDDTLFVFMGDFPLPGGCHT